MTQSRRVVVITGAGGALGAALSATFAGEPDTDVVLSDVSATSLDATVAGLPDGTGSVETVLADVSDVGQVEAVVARAVERFGRLDVLISNAGVLAPNGRIHNLATEDWQRAFRINVMGAVNGIRAAVPVMRAQKSGSIVLTASVAGLTAWSHARPVLRDEGRRDFAGEGRSSRVRARRHPGQLRVSRHVPFGDPRTPPAGGDRRDRGEAPARARLDPRSSLARTPTWPATSSRWTTGSAMVVDGGYSAP